MAKESDVEMIKNNKISEFLDQYSNEQEWVFTY